MGWQICLLLVSSYVASAVTQGHHSVKQTKVSPVTSESSLSSKPKDDIDYNTMGRYENIARSTVQILPIMSTLFESLTPDAAIIRSGEPFDSELLKRVIMALIPVTREVMLATAKAEGRSVQKKVLARLDAMEKALPAAFDFMANIRNTDFHGVGEDYAYFNNKAPYWNHDGEKVEPKKLSLPVKYDPEKFSGSIVSMPNQKPTFINHPPKHLWDNAHQ